MKPMDFKDRWVLVTGASSGLGHAFTEKLVREHGAFVLAVARRKERLEALAAGLPPGRVEHVVADLSRLEDVDRVIAVARGKPLYGAILNAGVTHFGPFEDLSWEDFQKMLDTNVRSSVRLATELLPRLEEHGGGIMLLSSMTGLLPVPYQSAYAGTKAFLATFGISLSHELKGRSITVTTYAPGGVATEMTQGGAFTHLRGWLMDVDKAATSGLEGFRQRKDLHVPGVVYRVGQALIGVIPRKLFVGGTAAVYRRALNKAGRAG